MLQHFVRKGAALLHYCVDGVLMHTFIINFSLLGMLVNLNWTANRIHQSSCEPLRGIGVSPLCSRWNVGLQIGNQIPPREEIWHDWYIQRRDCYRLMIRWAIFFNLMCFHGRYLQLYLFFKSMGQIPVIIWIAISGWAQKTAHFKMQSKWWRYKCLRS